MSRISNVSQDEKVFTPFVTAGDPNLKTTERLTPAMAEAGADLVETGIPLSDPVTGGIVVQKTDMRTLASGTTTDKMFEMVRRIWERVDTSLAFMTYISPILVHGAERFLIKCKECRVDALIVSDMSFEERQELPLYYHQYNIGLISLIALTPRERVAAIAREAERFVYCVSSAGTTGVRAEITTDIGEMVSLVKKESDIPCAIGFGISTLGQAKKIAAFADGVIMGSAIVRIVAQCGTGCIAPVCDYVKTMKAAISRHRYKYIVIPAPARPVCQ